MSKPLIGVMPLWDEGKKSIWMLPGYLEGIREAGGTPVIFPLTEDREELEQLCSLCNGFLITGGQDVDPAIYRETPSPQMGGDLYRTRSDGTSGAGIRYQRR